MSGKAPGNSRSTAGITRCWPITTPAAGQYSASIAERISKTDAVYPGAAPKEDHTPASITIANGKTQMDFAGFTYLLDGPRSEGGPPNTTMFNQADLGYARDDPELYQDKWHALENRVFDFLDSGHPLTISAEGKSYVLPLVNAPRWRARFQKIC
jgi:hypothetical protein